MVTPQTELMATKFENASYDCFSLHSPPPPPLLAGSIIESTHTAYSIYVYIVNDNHVDNMDNVKLLISIRYQLGSLIPPRL